MVPKLNATLAEVYPCFNFPCNACQSSDRGKINKSFEQFKIPKLKLVEVVARVRERCARRNLQPR